MNATQNQLVAALKERIRRLDTAVLVIDGDCAAGKTTLAAQIAAQLDCNVFHMDDFFLPQAMRTADRLSEAGGNVHYERFMEQVLVPLIQNKPFAYGVYSCADGATRTVDVIPKPAAVIEGSYALHPHFLEKYESLDAVKVFLRVDPEEQLRRIARRSGETMLRRFREEWIPMEKRYQQAFLEAWGDVQFIIV
jgi:uridine kinase